MKNTAKSTRPISTTTPSVAVMTPPSRTPGPRGAGPGSSLARKKGTHRGGSPSSPQPRSWIAQAGRFLRRNGRSDLGGNAFVEGEGADLIRPQLDPVRDVLAVPRLGDTARSIGVLTCLPQAERDARLVAGVRQTVPDEPGLVPELAQHPVLCDVGELLEGPLLDLVRSDTNMLHGCSPLLECP